MRLRHVIVKEFRQLRRDPRMIPIIFVAPVIQLLVLGNAANMDVVDLRLAVCDGDSTPASRDLARALTA